MHLLQTTFAIIVVMDKIDQAALGSKHTLKRRLSQFYNDRPFSCKSDFELK